MGPASPELLPVSSTVSRCTMGTKARWLGPVTGPDAFNCSTLHETGAAKTTSLSPVTIRGDDPRGGRDLRLTRRLISHPFAQQHQAALLVARAAVHLGLGDANAPFDHVAPLAVVPSSQTSHVLLLLGPRRGSLNTQICLP
jgi:hypothetical protein